MPRSTSCASPRFGRAWRCSRLFLQRTSSPSTRTQLLSFVRDSLLFPWRARRRRIDTVINTEAFVRYSSVLSYLSGARRRVGFHRFNQEGMYTGDLLTHKVLYNGQIHAAHTFLDLVHALEAPADNVPRVKRPKAMDCLDVPKIVTDAGAADAIWRKLRAIAPDIGPTQEARRGQSECERQISDAPHAA